MQVQDKLPISSSLPRGFLSSSKARASLHDSFGTTYFSSEAKYIDQEIFDTWWCCSLVLAGSLTPRTTINH